MQNSNLRFSRIGQLFWSDLHNTWRRNLLIFGGLFIFCFIVYTILKVDGLINNNVLEELPDYGVHYVKIHFIIFPIVLLVGGFVFTSISFWELRFKPSLRFYLTLPATGEEKILSKWLLSAILFPLSWLLAYQLFAQLTYYSFSSSGYNMIQLSMFDPWVWLWIGIYILVQSVFFLGAVALPKYALIKTAIILGLLVGLLALFYDFSLYTLLPLFSEKVMVLSEVATTRGFSLKDDISIEPTFRLYIINQFPKLVITVLGLIILPITLIISFLKLKEKEV